LSQFSSLCHLLGRLLSLHRYGIESCLSGDFLALSEGRGGAVVAGDEALIGKGLDLLPSLIAGQAAVLLRFAEVQLQHQLLLVEGPAQ